MNSAKGVCSQWIISRIFADVDIIFFLQAVKLIEYDSAFSEEEKKQAKALKVACNLNNAACKLKLKDYKQAEKLCTKVRLWDCC